MQIEVVVWGSCQISWLRGDGVRIDASGFLECGKKAVRERTSQRHTSRPCQVDGLFAARG